MQSLQEKSDSKSQVEKFLDATAHYLSTHGFLTEPYGVRPVAILRDGHSVSLQASGSYYSRKYNGRWTAVEMWHFTCPIPGFLLADRDEEDDGPLGYVPIDLADLFVAMHGGIDIEASIAAHHD